jgi:hypothetical protein
MSETPLCTRHALPQIQDKKGRFIGRCKTCIAQDSKQRKLIARKGRPSQFDVTIHFGGDPDLFEFIQGQAKTYRREVDQEILYRLSAYMRSAQKQYKAKGE